MDHVLLDLDGTLIDAEYRLTDDRICAAIAGAQARGWSIGVNSDSAMATCRRWHRRLGMNGCLVAEKGAAFFVPGQGVAAVEESNEDAFRELNVAFYRDIRVWHPEAFVVTGEVSALVHGDAAEVFVPESSEEVILINGHRRWSFHFYVRRRLADGQTSLDPALLRELVALTKRLVETDPRLAGANLDVSQRHGLCIVHHRRTSKARGVRALADRVGCSQVFMIGDSMDDFCGDPRVRQFAVGNASQEYKDRCERVAHAAVTAGVIELLESLPALL